MKKSALAQKFDHTLLKSDASLNNIKNLCNEALKYNFRSICINPIWIEKTLTFLNKSNIKLCTVVGFPLGANPSIIKLNEVDYSIDKGATEIDMVMNIGLFKDKKYFYVAKEISDIVKKCNGRIVKVIIEAGVLNQKELKLATNIVEDNGGDFIKTSTGFSSFGATKEVIEIIKNNIKFKTKIKASGGINRLNQVIELLSLGVDVIGSSSSAIIMEELSTN
tara:strand:+ start:70 stop:732 length:663 start_codon:yes stop_codon:yes gene_type:complete